MRKNLYFLMVVAAMASVSCIKENINAVQPQIPSDAVTINAVAENDATLKSSLSDGKVLWHNGDAVSVWNGSAACEFVTADPDGTESAMFVASSSDYQQADNYLALYPHSADALFADGKVNAAVPAVQEAFAGGFAKGVNVAVASGSGEGLLFRNVCGYVKFTVPAGMTDLTKVEFAANSPQEYLAGNVNVTIADEPSAEVTSEGSASVSLEGAFEAGASYYIAVLPQTLSKGFTITMTRGEETSTMTTDKPFTISRSKAKPVGELYDGVWQVRLEGSAVPEGYVDMQTYSTGFCSYRGQLAEGKLSVRVLYENLNVNLADDGSYDVNPVSEGVSQIDIPAAGYYHILMNTNDATYKIYTQDVYVDLGKRGETAAPWNNIKTNTEGTYALSDTEGNAEALSLTIGAGFNLYDSATNVDERGNYSYMDDVMMMTLWYDGLTFGGTKGEGDVGPKTLTISNMEASSTYDIRIVSVRFNGSKTARKTKFELSGVSDSMEICQGIKIANASGSYSKWDDVPIEEYVCVFENVAPDTEGNVLINITAIDTGSACDAHINAIQIFKRF